MKNKKRNFLDREKKGDFLEIGKKGEKREKKIKKKRESIEWSKEYKWFCY